VTKDITSEREREAQDPEALGEVRGEEALR